MLKINRPTQQDLDKSKKNAKALLKFAKKKDCTQAINKVLQDWDLSKYGLSASTDNSASTDKLMEIIEKPFTKKTTGQDELIKEVTKGNPLPNLKKQILLENKQYLHNAKYAIAILKMINDKKINKNKLYKLYEEQATTFSIESCSETTTEALLPLTEGAFTHDCAGNTELQGFVAFVAEEQG